MSGMNHSQPRPLSGMKTLKRCQNNGEADNIVLIDVDSDSFDSVIIIDVPENLTKKLRGSKGLKNNKSCPLKTYIYIDDDESPNNHHAETGVESSSKFDCGASSSKRYGPATNHSPDTHFPQENISPLKLSKGKRTYSGRAYSNRYGFSSQSDSDSSDDDSPDCEFMEDSSGKLREQWERASLKKKADVHNDQCDTGGHSSASSDAHDKTGINENKQQNAGVPSRSDSKKSSNERGGQSPTAPTGRVQSNWESMSSDPRKSSLDESNLNSRGKTHIHYNYADIDAQGESLMDDLPCCNSQQNQHSSAHINRHEDRISGAESISLDSDSSSDVDACQGKYNLPVDNTSCNRGQCSVESDDCDQSGYGHSDEKCEPTPSTINPLFSSGLEELPILGEREKLKETDEYKRALEEELSARQRALKIQAEEAQHLRRLAKRRKAENLRLLDTERRQKQRLEEIRETQKKDEENMNLKEQHRTEVAKELEKLQMSCPDMASLLRGLGIQVAGGPKPSSHEVRLAYKRALVSFHPDRASGSDMRQQVEAEEKFKFISHMKEKLSPTL